MNEPGGRAWRKQGQSGRAAAAVGQAAVVGGRRHQPSTRLAEQRGVAPRAQEAWRS